jgi:hypothetical protein
LKSWFQRFVTRERETIRETATPLKGIASKATIAPATTDESNNRRKQQPTKAATD